jgi:tetratricopeptide (TPR) repeat protein
VVLTALAWLGWQRQEVFATSFNLWTDTVAKSPASDNAANNLGYAWLRKGDNAKALAAFERALQLTNGKKADAWAGAAIALDRMGRPSDAVQALRRAVEIMPIYGNPDQLVKSLVAEPADAEAWREIRSHAVIDP